MIRRVLLTAGVLLGLGAIGLVVVQYYSFLFSKVVVGQVERVERVVVGAAILQTEVNAEARDQLFSFAIAIRDRSSNEIFTSSSEDRQWAVVSSGQCAEVRLYPYPPWNLQKAGTFGNARLERLFDCPTAP